MKKLSIWVLIFTALYALGQRSPQYGIDLETECLQAQLRHEAPSPDILFVGNSWIGSAVDTAFLETELSQRLGRPIKVERLINLGANIFKYQLDLKSYVANRGWPDIVVISIFSNIGAPIDYSEIPIFDIKSLKLHDWQSLREANNDYLDNYRGSRLKRVLDSSWYSDIELLLFKVTDSIYRSVKLLSSTLYAPYYCGAESGFAAKPKYLPHGALEAGKVYDPSNGLITPEPVTLKVERSKSARHYPLQIDAQDRYLEVHKVREVITLGKGRDVRFFVTQVPILGWPNMGPNSMQAMQKLIPEAPYVNSYRMFEMPGAEPYAQNAFRNYSHLNLNGAHLFSSFWIDFLAERLHD